MPITEPAVDGSPLTQGDILQDIRLFATAKAWEDAKGDANVSPFNMCIILSRPCVIEHKTSVIVAAVDKIKVPIPGDTDTFEKMVSFLTTLRDGSTSPDVFYLGQFPGEHKGA